MVKYLGNINKITAVIIALFMVVLLGILDLTTGVEFSFAIFYLMPISFASWYIGYKYGIFFSVLSSIAWFNADIQLIERYTNPTAPYWNAVVRLGFFLVVVMLIGQVKKLAAGLEKKVEEKTTDLLNEIEERKKAENELQIKTKKLSELANRVLKMQEEQNIHIAREIHDELGQVMTAIKIDLMWLSKRYNVNPDIVESLFSVTQTVDDAISTIRHISSNLRPRLLDELGFIPAVERFLKDYKTKTAIDYVFKNEQENYQLEKTEQNALFRIVQEALTNTARHSDATGIELNIYSDEGNKINLSIKDNGKGLPKNYKMKKNSLGILGMEERAEGVGGIFAISSVQGNGTFINIRIPKK